MAKLKFFYSSMGAGKSLDLLRINDNYKRLNKRCLLMKPEIDNRFDKNKKIISRIGIEEDCITFSNTDKLDDIILSELSKEVFHCVLVDEAQFMVENSVWALANVVDWTNIPVICFGLRTDYNGNVFKGSNILLGIADELKEIITLCHCGNKAIMTLRFDPKTGIIIKEQDSDDNIHIGDKGYVSVCRKHWDNGDIGK